MSYALFYVSYFLLSLSLFLSILYLFIETQMSKSAACEYFVTSPNQVDKMNSVKVDIEYW